AVGHTGGLALEGVKARAGDSDLSGRLDIAFGGARPTITADLSARHVALREFLPPADAPDEGAAPPAADGAASEVRLRKLLDLPLPTANLGAYDAEVDFRAEEISGAPAELRKLALTLSLRAGALTLSPVDLTVGGEVLHGRLAYRARATPALNFNVFASQVDLHAAARRFSGQEDAQAQAQAARLSFAGSGRTPREMLAGATFALAADALSLRARGADGRALSMALEQGRLVVTDGGPLRLNVTGRLGGQPLNVAATGGNMASLLAEDGAWPIEAELVLGKLQLDAQGALGLARDTPHIELALSVAGAQMADLQPALPFRLPPLGSFKLTAELQGGTQGLSLHDIKGRIGDNELAGKVEWGIAGGRPLVTAGIVVERLQLPADEPDAASEPARSEPPARGTLERPYPLELLRGLDADLDLRIKRISRGGTRLGDARFHAQLHHGLLTLDPLRAQVLGGIVQGRVTLDATGSAPPQTFEGTVRDFDYGALMQVLGVSRLVEGKMDLDFAVSGQGGSLKETLRTLEGTAAFTGSRGKVENRYLRFWGTNLFLIWRPFFRDETVTRINCAAGRFEIEQGVATARKLVVDTPEITIRGTGTMDFGADRIALNLRPKSKSISLISLATAVDVTGQLSQPNIGVAPATIAENLTWLALGLTFPQALVLGFGSTGERDGNPCADKPEAEAEQSSRTAAPQN
ncbi:MAG: AsmA family protein, partial [Candidatus Lambdaproteobacteria bacterium]|nr:AsmA family protein [Candidatus Lambdaproteobacteria bacterium]